MKVPIVVVITNAGDRLESWLRSVKELHDRDGIEAMPCIVDNASWDNTTGIIWDAIQRKQVSMENVFSLPKNHGFASAQNHAFWCLGARGKYDFVATLNEDATADPGWLIELAAAAQSSADKVGMWGGLILRPDKTKSISSAGHYLRGRDGAFFDIDWNKARYDEENNHSKEDFEPFSPCFAAALWSFEMLKQVGFPDGDRFYDYDDVDLAYKARIEGWSAGFVKDAVAYHTLPTNDVGSGRMEARIEGKLSIVARYFPDEERMKILESLNYAERVLLERLPIRRRLPFGSNLRRKEIFEKWKDRYNTESHG